MSATTTPRTTVTEREARQVAEAARQQDWHKPSFAKELFLGRFRLDLIHPHPLPDDESVRRGGFGTSRRRSSRCRRRACGGRRPSVPTP
ncbi:hypothetical protein SCANM63S_00220 [Streptomyces canarius]